MNSTIMALTLRALLGRRRALLLLPMPVLLVGLTLIATIARSPVDHWGLVVFGHLGFGVILPLTALIVGSSVLGLEIEDGTITHLLTKPLARSEIILSKLAVAWGVTSVATVVPLVLSALIAGSPGLAVGLGVGAVVGALAYSAVFLALSVLSRRPVALGLLYIMLWENVLVQFVSGARVLSVQQYASTLADGISGDRLLGSTLPAMAASLLAAVFVLVGTYVATSRLRSFRLTGETS
ncbi:MAG TPA: ABC transporter permease [Pseudonocardiaceae bacterium]|nr:ABC transporter permease [Pseudonocardiaceae bacterium]